MKKAFSMIELVFVIVIIGILSAVAVPRLFSVTDTANIANIKSQIQTIRGAIISVRNKNILTGNKSYPPYLDDADSNKEGEELFDGNSSIGYLLDYPIISKNADGHWMKTADRNYTAKVMGVDVTFEYTPDDRGKFDCRNSNSDSQAQEMCKKLVN